MITQILPTTKEANKFYGTAEAFLKRAIAKGGIRKEAYSLNNNACTILILVGEQVARAYIIASATGLFATHPSEFHEVPYPFNPIQRGIVSQDLTYTPPKVDDTTTKIEAGNCYWSGLDKLVSWKGSMGFNLEMDTSEFYNEITIEDTQNQALINPKYTSFDKYIYEGQTIIWEKEEHLVLGACYNGATLLVLARINNGSNFYIKAYANQTEIGELLVGRYNNIWNFKSDGSTGISYEGGKVYRCAFTKDSDNNFTCIFNEPTDANTSFTIDMHTSTIDDNTTSSNTEYTPNDLPDLFGGLIPVDVSEMETTDQAIWLAIKDKETTSISIAKSSGSGTGEYIIGYAYDNYDNEIPLIAEVSLDVDHNYKSTVFQKNDAMLVMPEGSSGTVVQGNCGHPADVDPADYVCGGASTFTNCSGGTYVIDFGAAPTLTFNISNPVLVNNTISASGGVPPFSYSATAGSWTQVGNTYKFTGCGGAGAPAFATVTVTDACGSTAQAAAVFNGSWQVVSDNNASGLACGTNQGGQGYWTASWIISGSRYGYGSIGSLPSPVTTGSATAVYHSVVYWQGLSFSYNNCISQPSCYDNKYVAGQTAYSGTVSASPGYNYTACQFLNYYWYVNGRNNERIITYEWRCV